MSESGDVKLPEPTQFTAKCWFDDSCILDIDYFVKTLAGIRAKGVRPNLIGSIIAHYSSKWLPDLSAGDGEAHRSHGVAGERDGIVDEEEVFCVGFTSYRS